MFSQPATGPRWCARACRATRTLGLQSNPGARVAEHRNARRKAGKARAQHHKVHSGFLRSSFLARLRRLRKPRDGRAGRSVANQRVQIDGSREAPGSRPEVGTGKRKRRAARGGGAGGRIDSSGSCGATDGWSRLRSLETI